MIIAERTKLNNLLTQQSRLKNDINGLKGLIESLSQFSSVHQIHAWKKRKRNLTIRLNQVEADIKALNARIRGEA